MEIWCERRFKIPYISCNIDEFCNFLSTILDEFFEGKANISISVSISDHKLFFSSLDEFKLYDKLPSIIYSISVHIRPGNLDCNKYVSMYLSNDLNSVDIRGSSQVWSQSVEFVISSYIKRFRPWYWRFRQWMFLILSYIFLAVLIISFNEKIHVHSESIYGFLLGFYLFFSYIFFRFKGIFRKMVLVVKKEESLLRAYNAEITFAFGVIGFLGWVIDILIK